VTTTLSALTGIALGGGLLLVIIGLFVEPGEKRPRRESVALRRVSQYVGLGPGGRLHKYRWIMLGGAILGLVVGLISGWYALVIAIPVAAVALPILLVKETSSQDATMATDLTTWVRALSGNLVGGQAGLEVAIRSTYRGAPDKLKPALAMLIARLDAAQPIKSSLRAWADEVDDYSADLVAAVLILEADRRSGGVSEALGELAKSLADQAKALQEVENERSGARTSVRLVTIVTVVVLVGASLSGYMAPYGTPLGQVVFLVLFAAFLGTLAIMRYVGQGKPIPRFLPAPKGA
jgi:tight adherence protein B